MAAPALLVCDVGNTALKIVLFDGAGAVRQVRRFPHPRPVRRRARDPGTVVAVSVHEGHLARIRNDLRPVRIRVLGRDLPLPIRNRTRRPSETGHDRLCAALAAYERAGGAAVAVGLGTALTVDLVDAAGAFRGGAIAPGLRAAAAGLAGAAPRLPAPDLGARHPASLPGRTTAKALRAGFLIGFAGMVDRLAEEAARAARRGGVSRVPVFLHGGDAPALLPYLETPVTHAPHLVAEGARLAWLRSKGAGPGKPRAGPRRPR